MIPQDAKVCSHCRRSQGAFPLKLALLVIIAIFALFFISNPLPATRPNAMAPKENFLGNVTVEKMKYRKNYDYIIITGNIVNNNNIDIGVQLKTTAYDKSGDPLKVSDYWPASIRNIPANSTYTFESMMNFVPGTEKFETHPIGTKVWN